MKKFITLFLASFIAFGAQAQLTAFPSPGLTIGAEYAGNPWLESSNLSMQYVNDTVLCGTTLHIFQDITGLPGVSLNLLHYEAGEVHLRNFSDPCDPGILVYDFSLEIGQSITVVNAVPSEVTETGQFTLDNGEERKYLKLSGLPPYDQPYNDQFWVDGIGDINRGFFRRNDFEGGAESFICAKDNSGILYQNSSATLDCDSLTCYPALPRFEYSCDNSTIYFENNSLYSDGYYWDFGDGNFSTETNPVHTYLENGCYKVRLIASTDCLPVEFEETMLVPVGEPNYFTTIFDNELEDVKPFSNIHFIDAQKGWAVTQRKIFRTTDGGLTWEEQFMSNTSQNMQSVHFLDENHGVVSVLDYGYILNVLLTDNGGETWMPKNVSLVGTFDSYMLSPEFIYASGETEVIKSTNGGDNWELIDVPGASLVVDIFPLSEEVLYTSLTTGFGPNFYPTLFGKTLDGGLTWSLVELPFDELPSSIFFNNEMEGWIGTRAGRILYTSDGGANWETQLFDPEITDINDIQFISPNEGWAMSRFGHLYHTTDSGQNWILRTCHLADDLFRAIEFISSSVGFLSAQVPFSNDANLMSFQTSAPAECGVVSSTGESEENNFSIYPNPANQSVTIELNANMVSEKMELNLWSAQGISVKRKIIMGKENKVNLDLSGIPAGMYFLSLNHEHEIEITTKLVIQ